MRAETCSSVNKVVLKYITALVGVLGKIEKKEYVLFVFCVEPFKYVIKLLHLGLQYWVKYYSSESKLYLAGTPTKIYESLREVCGDPKLDGRKLSCWYQRFCLGQDGIKDKERPGRLRTSTDSTSGEIIAIILSFCRKIYV